VSLSPSRLSALAGRDARAGARSFKYGDGAEGGPGAIDSLLSSYSGKLKTLRTSQVLIPSLIPQTERSARSWSLIGH
jgi:hypothetical protein